MLNRSFSTILLLVYILLVFLLGHSPLRAEDDQKSVSSSTKQELTHRFYDAHCGLYCAYTLLKVARRDVDFIELLEPEYIGSWKGSSLAELKKAIEDHGLHAEAVQNIATSELEASPYPIILHVKSCLDTREYDHFELFLGAQDGLARLFDPPNPLKLVPLHELVPRWDSTGLVVSATPIDVDAIFAPTRKRFIVYATITITVVLALRLIGRHCMKAFHILSLRKLLLISAFQSGILCTTALIGAFLYHFVNNEGFLAHRNATSGIVEAHLGNFIPKIKVDDTANLLKTNTVFIDARQERDYKTGHLEGAINIPVNSSEEERRAKLADVAKDCPIVVYCQSQGCGYAEKTAIALLSDGFMNVSIFKGGWIEWNKRYKK